jgi:hypothetical protein
VEIPRLASGVRRWSTTAVATVASSYALDAIASAAGLGLLASGLLNHLDFPWAVAFLTGTYLFWGTALSSSLAANWRLLEDTGTSTNLLSKAGYDLAARLRMGGRARKAACGGGYVAFEIAKETPYYAAAFGIAAFSELISNVEAVLFLGGANIGAAAYEYGLAWSTREILSRRREAGHSSFETDWHPKEYLGSYYSDIDVDERETISFFVDAAKKMPRDQPVLFVGTGPTLHHVFAVAEIASEIHLSDYLRPNLDEIAGWIGGKAGAHDWTPFVRYTLECEGVAQPSACDIAEREWLTRRKISRLLDIDLRKEQPLGEAARPYATVVSAYCADSATADHETWRLYMRRIMDLVEPGGTVLVAALRGARRYFVNGNSFPSPAIDERDMRRVLLPYFSAADLTVEAFDVPGCEPHGYCGIVLAAGHNRRAAVSGFGGTDSLAGIPGRRAAPGPESTATAQEG